MPKSIVARTTLAIVLLALLLGAVFAGLAAWTLQNNEKDRLTTRLDALLQPVEKTVSIACFVKYGALAREVVSGLISNEEVAGVRILADGQTRYEQSPLGND